MRKEYREDIEKVLKFINKQSKYRKSEEKEWKYFLPNNFNQFKTYYKHLQKNSYFKSYLNELKENLVFDFDKLHISVVSFSKDNYINNFFQKKVPLILKRRKIFAKAEYNGTAITANYDEYLNFLTDSLIDFKKENISILIDEYSYLNYLRDKVIFNKDLSSYIKQEQTKDKEKKLLNLYLSHGQLAEERERFMLIDIDKTEYFLVINKENKEILYDFKFVFYNIFKLFVELLVKHLKLNLSISKRKLIVNLLWFIFNKYTRSLFFQKMTNEDIWKCKKAIEKFNSYSDLEKVRLIEILNTLFVLLINYDEKKEIAKKVKEKQNEEEDKITDCLNDYQNQIKNNLTSNSENDNNKTKITYTQSIEIETENKNISINNLIKNINKDVRKDT